MTIDTRRECLLEKLYKYPCLVLNIVIEIIIYNVRIIIKWIIYGIRNESEVLIGMGDLIHIYYG